MANDILYIVTEEAQWADPQNQLFNVDEGTVVGTYFEKQNAINKINELLECPLYKSFNGRWINEHTAEIDSPNRLKAVFHIYKYKHKMHIIA